MDPTSEFFAKLRKLAVTLESETAKLQQAFDNRRSEDDAATTARATRAFHELNCEVVHLKGQVQRQLAQQKARVNEVSRFITASTVMEKRVTEDIQVLKTHCEKYGYKAPQRPKETEHQKPETLVADEDAIRSAGEIEGSQEEAGGHHSSSPPVPGAPPPFTDALRTPQLSDFGLSELQLKRILTGADWCSEMPPMPEMNLPRPSLNTPAPPMPLTPKCALRIDDDELQTPQMHDFGISEHTVFLNNDFTIDLFQNCIKKPQRSQDIPDPPVNSLTEMLQKKEKFKSPEPPVFCTPGFKIKKRNGHCFPPAQENGEPTTPGCPENLSTTPEVPAFQTPYVTRLVSTKKSTLLTEPIRMQVDDNSHTFELPTPPHNGAAASEPTWEYNVPKLTIMSAEDRQVPEMPNLDSVLGSSLQSKKAKISKKTSSFEKATKDYIVKNLELDGPTQEFSLRSPCIRIVYQELSTPEMPDLSSVTRDTCKLVSQAQLKKASLADVHSHVKPEKEKNRVIHLSVVLESEFQSLPSYLKQMTLRSLNQAVHNINTFIEEAQGQTIELQMEELRKIINAGTKTPVYILCLTELKRLKLVGGANNTSLYKPYTNY